jgi:uncharacterized membrane protein YdcZ (DUF606 family)
MAAVAKDLNMADKVNGPVSAALLASGIGCAAMGFITLIYEINDKSAFAKSLAWNKGVGGLSGKSMLLAKMVKQSLLPANDWLSSSYALPVLFSLR